MMTVYEILGIDEKTLEMCIASKEVQGKEDPRMYAVKKFGDMTE